MLHFYRRLLQLRRGIATAEFAMLDGPPDLLAWARSDGEGARHRPCGGRGVVCRCAQPHAGEQGDGAFRLGWRSVGHPRFAEAARRDHGGNPTRLRDALAEVSDQFHAVLIDCPPSLDSLSTSGLSAASHAVIVVEPSALGLRGSGAVADVVDDVWDAHNPDLELSGVIVNKVPAVSNEADRRYEELTRIVGKRAIWQPVIPHRVIVNQAIGDRRPIHTYGMRSADVSEAFDKLWAKLRRITKP